jgi:hypothetical protein
MDRYTHLGLVDQTAALDKLPALPSQRGNAPEVMKATGTDGALAPRLPFPCRDGDETRGNMRKRDVRRASDERGRGETQSLAIVGHDAPCHRKMKHDDADRPRGGMVDTGDIKSPVDSQISNDPSESQRALAVPLPSDPELARLIVAWPTLPEALRAGIVAMIDAAKKM